MQAIVFLFGVTPMIRVEVAENIAAELIDMETTVNCLMQKTADVQSLTGRPMVISDYLVDGVHGPVWVSVQYVPAKGVMRVMFKSQVLEMNAHPDAGNIATDGPHRVSRLQPRTLSATTPGKPGHS
jgi:hypothetical protein